MAGTIQKKSELIAETEKQRRIIHRLIWSSIISNIVALAMVSLVAYAIWATG
jgi:hypothetical protein